MLTEILLLCVWELSTLPKDQRSCPVEGAAGAKSRFNTVGLGHSPLGALSAGDERTGGQERGQAPHRAVAAESRQRPVPVLTHVPAPGDRSVSGGQAAEAVIRKFARDATKVGVGGGTSRGGGTRRGWTGRPVGLQGLVPVLPPVPEAPEHRSVSSGRAAEAVVRKFARDAARIGVGGGMSRSRGTRPGWAGRPGGPLLETGPRCKVLFVDGPMAAGE